MFYKMVFPKILQNSKETVYDFIKKDTPYAYCGIFKKTFFVGQLQVNASERKIGKVKYKNNCY